MCKHLQCPPDSRHEKQSAPVTYVSWSLQVLMAYLPHPRPHCSIYTGLLTAPPTHQDTSSHLRAFTPAFSSAWNQPSPWSLLLRSPFEGLPQRGLPRIAHPCLCCRTCWIYFTDIYMTNTHPCVYWLFVPFQQKIKRLLSN